MMAHAGSSAIDGCGGAPRHANVSGSLISANGINMSVWEKLGFRENPFSTDPVPANDEGVKLLVGRDKELARLRMSLTSSTNHTTIEGANGVGKTSLVGIAAYTLFQDHLRDRNKPLYIPVERAFQISPSETAADFAANFVFTLAREIAASRLLKNSMARRAAA